MQPKHMKVVAIHIKITFHFLKFFISEPDIYFKASHFRDYGFEDVNWI